MAVQKAREVLGDAPVALVCDDFFTYAPPRPLELIYERAFLCALPRKLWTDWGRRVAELLPPGALLAGSAVLFQAGLLDAVTQTVCWCVIFFFASNYKSDPFVACRRVFYERGHEHLLDNLAGRKLSMYCLQ